MKRVVIAGTHSGCGKTTVSLGIMAALTKRGKKVAPFKVGPDYIDPSFHSFVTGNLSYNLDSWLLDSDTVKYLFNKNKKGMDICIIEGVMGMHDGFGIDNSNGSTSHVAKITKTPVVLVVEANAMSTSAAALIMGYMMYDKEVQVKGVIFNKVCGEKHYEMLKLVVEKNLGIKALGYLPKRDDISLKSRHLGLIPADEVEELNKKIDDLVELVEKHIDLKSLEEIGDVEEIGIVENPAKDIYMKYKSLKIGVPRDKAFSFYYGDNLQLMEEAGVKLLPFSPIKDKQVPKEVDGLYIGGGFPEIFAKELEENITMRENIKDLLNNGLPAYGECGGLMYLTNGILDLQGKYYKMVGFLDTESMMTNRLNRFGYINVETKTGIKIRAHEFHRSSIEENENLEYYYHVTKYREKFIGQWKCGLTKNNVVAGYPHIHFYSNLDFLKEFLDKCIEFKNR
ncbi:cobyrinic acid a,c-diamide synthase [Proteiniborus ethanoligenes]|uniref:Cobyrinate a,c-diamide synthase n=1 Tax=Proteiniborus ethanoligenes TaxID=415015 RepID=A0A1H3QK51_9FIRM|nr:cobyrinate a,c-diamide synthase [Proteiniborus ethanoligenes]SDZ13481.1 cobyrinic acid a,c-diamide synthase [Proteiniborus ethanoligenes]